jgi:hypothetical protein
MFTFLRQPPNSIVASYEPFAFLNAAQRFFVASPILFLAAALIFRRLRGGFGDSCAAGFTGISRTRLRRRGQVNIQVMVRVASLEY